jgi:hypothetical protein
MKSKLFTRRVLISGAVIVVCLALIKFLAHILVTGSYGYFIDELYTIAESRHLDFGYVDMPPLVPLILAAVGKLFGYSLFAIRFLPAVCGAFMVVMAYLMVKKMGGGRFAQILAPLAVLIVPVWLAMNSMYTYDCFDQLLSVIVFYVILRILDEENPRLWLVFGLVAGIGLMVKLSMLFLGFSLVLALLLTRNRKYFASRWLWLGGLVALAIVSPFIIWEIKHNWPIVEYWKIYGAYKTYHASFPEFIVMQILTMQPLTLPLWLAGLYWLLFSKDGRRYRMLGILYFVLFALFFITKGKVYMLSPAYVMLFAAGAVQMEKLAGKRFGGWLKPVYPLILIVTGVLAAPTALPVLPVDHLVKYFRDSAKFTGISQVKTEDFGKIELPQYFSDRFGWDNMVEKIAGVYRQLSPGEQSRCAIIARNYGQAGAVDLLGEKYGLPKAISGHLSYYLWGPGNFNGEIAIVVGLKEQDLRDAFETVEQVATINSQYAMPYQNNLPVFVCRKLKYPIGEIWPKIKSF